MWYRFPSPIVLEVSGRDAARYLNNRLTNDVRACSPGRPVRAALLNPQGRTEGIFSAHVREDGVFLLACEGGDPEAVKSALCRYIVADRVTVTDLSSAYVLLHIADSKAQAEAVRYPGAFVAPVSRTAPGGIDLLLPAEAFERWSSEAEARGAPPMERAEFDLARARFGAVSYPDEVNADTIVTEVGLRDLVSFSKGCYVGQEVIERSDAIGKLPRKLERARFSGSATLRAGTAVTTSAGEAIGKVVSAFPDPSAGEIIAFVLLRAGRYDPGAPVAAGDLSGELIARNERGGE